MGYLVFLAVIDGLKDATSLHRLPESMPWRAFLSRDGKVLIEWMRRPNPNNVPRSPIIFPKNPEFAIRPSGTSFGRTFGDVAPGLDGLYDNLSRQRKAGTIPGVAVRSALLLNQLTDCSVLALVSDDEDWDFACEVRDGRVHAIAFISDKEEIHLDHAGIVSRMDLGETQRELHRIARREAARWSSELSPLFGFDGFAGELGLVEIDRARQTDGDPQDTPSPSGRKPFWKFW